MEVKIYKSNLNVNKSVQCQTIEKNSSKKKKILLFITLSLTHPMIFRHTNFNFCTKRVVYLNVEYVILFIPSMKNLKSF